MPTIGINAHLLSSEASYRRAGIHHYMAQLLRHLPTLPDWHYHLYSQHTPAMTATPTVHHSRFPTHQRLVRIVWEQTALPLLARQHQLDLLHSLAFVLPIATPCPAIVTIYDLSFIVFPDRFPRLQRHYLTSQTRYACRHAQRLVTISQSTKQDIHTHFGVSLDKIDVVAPGVDAHFQPRPIEEVTAFKQREGLSSQFILHVGTLQPRKNLPLLIEAFAELRQMPTFQSSDLQLVLVGGKGWFYEEIFQSVTRLHLENHVRFTGYVSDQDLPLWYNAGNVLVFPSIYEGFGLPIVQAMACGTPVIAANTSSIPEVSGPAALLFEPQDQSALVNHLCNVLQNPAKAHTMQQQGIQQAQHFTWIQAGQHMQTIYQKTWKP